MHSGRSRATTIESRSFAAGSPAALMLRSMSAVLACETEAAANSKLSAVNVAVAPPGLNSPTTSTPDAAWSALTVSDQSPGASGALPV